MCALPDNGPVAVLPHPLCAVPYPLGLNPRRAVVGRYSSVDPDPDLYAPAPAPVTSWPKRTHRSERPSPSTSATPSAAPTTRAKAARVTAAPTTPAKAARVAAASTTTVAATVPTSPRERGARRDGGQEKDAQAHTQRS